MDTRNKTKLWVRWRTSNRTDIARIRTRFGMPSYTTVNGFTPCEIEPRDMPLLKETARRGFISIINEKWQKNGGAYSLPSRK